MRPTISATILAAATSLAAGDNDHNLTSKCSKSSCSSSPKLEKFCNEAPADFAGTYNICYANIVREAGIASGAYHACLNGEVDSAEVFKPLDEYGAYESTLVVGGSILGGLVGGDGSISFSYQGIAQGNSIKMTSYGDGVKDGDGNTIRQNETPDTEECTLYGYGILKCIARQTEYCGASDNSQGPVNDSCEVGTWLHTYTIETISALEGFDCPEPPAGFCESGTPFGDGRKLQEEEEEGASHPCPLLNGKMN